MAQAQVSKLIFLYGSPEMMKYDNTGADIAAGDVVEIRAGALMGIAHSDIKQNMFGNLSRGHGYYLGVGDGVLAQGDNIYWDSGSGKVSATSTTNGSTARFRSSGSASRSKTKC